MSQIPQKHPTLGDISAIIPKWQAVEVLFVEWLAAEREFNPSCLSDRADDCAGRAGHIAYAQAANYLRTAYDHHELLLEMAEHDLMCHYYAAWSPLRALFETSFLSLWILHPTEPEERVRNGLAMALDDRRQHGRRQDLYCKLRASQVSQEERALLERVQRQQDEATRDLNALGAPYGLSMKSTGVAVTAQIQQSGVFAGEGKDMAEMVWRLASSLQHGDTAALFSTSRVVPVPESSAVDVEFDAESFLIAYGFVLDLLHVLLDRCSQGARPRRLARQPARCRR